MKLLNYTIEMSLGSLHKWTHFKIHRHNQGGIVWRHLVWGKFSLIFGQPHLAPVRICTVCDSDAVGEVHAGDEGWTVCEDCGSIEQGTYEITTEEWEKRA